MNVSAERIVRRFVADQIADPHEYLDMFKKAVFLVSEHAKFAADILPKWQAWKDADEKKMREAIQQTGEYEYPFPENFDSTYEARKHIKNVVRYPQWFPAMQRVGQRLFWAILQQYSLPPNLQKAIEAASKFWSKTRLNAVKPAYNRDHPLQTEIDYLTAFVKITTTLQKQVLNAEAALAKGKLHSDPTVAAKTKIRAGSFDVVNTGGFDDDTMKKAAELVEKADKLMTAHGLSNVCYGDILISKTITQKSNVAAFYLPSSDEMFVRANTPNTWDTVQTVCHELAHRLEHKFMSAKRAEIEGLYRRLQSNQITFGRKDLPRIGEVVEANGHTFKVINVNPRKQTVMYRDEETPPNQYWEAPLPAWLKKTGKPMPEQKEGFITGYASTSSAENFAEMVSYYVLGKLPKNQVDLLEPILR